MPGVQAKEGETTKGPEVSHYNVLDFLSGKQREVIQKGPVVADVVGYAGQQQDSIVFAGFSRVDEVESDFLCQLPSVDKLEETLAGSSDKYKKMRNAVPRQQDVRFEVRKYDVRSGRVSIEAITIDPEGKMQISLGESTIEDQSVKRTFEKGIEIRKGLFGFGTFDIKAALERESERKRSKDMGELIAASNQKAKQAKLAEQQK